MAWRIFVTFCLAAVSAAALELIPCPDCANPVSQRAVMCPACGCPGDVIAETAARLRTRHEGTPLRPVVRVSSTAANGFGLAVSDGGKRHILLALPLLGTAEAMDLSLLNTNQVIPYSHLELADNQPLARVAVTSTNLGDEC